MLYRLIRLNYVHGMHFPEFFLPSWNKTQAMTGWYSSTKCFLENHALALWNIHINIVWDITKIKTFTNVPDLNESLLKIQYASVYAQRVCCNHAPKYFLYWFLGVLMHKLCNRQQPDIWAKNANLINESIKKNFWLEFRIMDKENIWTLGGTKVCTCTFAAGP